MLKSMKFKWIKMNIYYITKLIIKFKQRLVDYGNEEDVNDLPTIMKAKSRGDWNLLKTPFGLIFNFFLHLQRSN